MVQNSNILLHNERLMTFGGEYISSLGRGYPHRTRNKYTSIQPSQDDNNDKTSP